MCVATGMSLLDGAQALWAFGDQAGMAVGPSLFHLRSVLSSQGSTTTREHPWWWRGEGGSRREKETGYVYVYLCWPVFSMIDGCFLGPIEMVFQMIILSWRAQHR